MNLTYYKYRFPFATPLVTSEKTFDHREGLFLEYSNSDFKCYGEIAPLPGYSPETLKEIQKKISKLKEAIEALIFANDPVDSLQEFYKEEELPASVQFGLDSIAHQIQAHREQKSLQNFLFADSMNQIPVNALESLQDEHYLQNIQQRISEGFQTIKFKIGIDFETEIKRLKNVRTRYPDLTIRLDANQAWSTESALRHFQKLEPLDIEYCEEPLKKATPENYELLNEHSPVPLALDESVSHLSYWPNLLPFTSYLILKPMILGSFTKNFETKRLADTHNNKAVFTTSLESSVGRHITAILASGLGSNQIAHGLSTGKLLNKDVDFGLTFISKGLYHINNTDLPSGIDFKKLDNVSLISM